MPSPRERLIDLCTAQTAASEDDALDAIRDFEAHLVALGWKRPVPHAGIIIHTRESEPIMPF